MAMLLIFSFLVRGLKIYLERYFFIIAKDPKFTPKANTMDGATF